MMWRFLMETMDPQAALRQQEQEQQHRKTIMKQLSENQFLQSIGIEFEWLADGSSFITSHNVEQELVLKCNIVHPKLTENFFRSLTPADIKSEDAKAFISYIIDTLYWQVINTYHISSEEVDDEFLNLIGEAWSIIKSCQNLGIEAIFLEDVLHYVHEHCLIEFRSIFKAGGHPSHTPGWIYPKKIWRDCPPNKFIQSWNTVLLSLQEAQDNPQANNLIKECKIHLSWQAQDMLDNPQYPDRMSWEEQEQRNNRIQSILQTINTL